MKIRNVIGLAGLALAATANAQTTFTNSTLIAIPDNSTTGVTSSVSSNLGGLVTQIQVTLQFGTTTTAGNREHTFMGDLLVQLRYQDSGGGDSGFIDIFSRVGRNSTTSTSLAPTAVGSPFGRGDDMNGTYNFGDQFFNTLWAPTTVAGSSGRGTAAVNANMPSNPFTANAFNPGTSVNNPAQGYRATSNAAGIIGADGTPLLVSLNGAFGAFSATGTWTLFVRDLGSGDTGEILSWSVTILPTPGAAALLGIGGLAATRRRRA
ncbi:MAG: hypothetical protein KIT68_09950 [Phycisphaeraceae bacterium]|nr:hypothetical protein [Phycisphaeraceae bacterium]